MSNLESVVFAWLANALALFAAAWIIPAIGYGDSWWTLLIAAAVFTAVNAVVRPLVIILTLPTVLLSLGAALFFINMLMLWLTSVFVPDFELGGFWSIAAGTAIVWLVNMALSALLRSQRRRPHGEGARG